MGLGALGLVVRTGVEGLIMDKGGHEEHFRPSFNWDLLLPGFEDSVESFERRFTMRFHRYLHAILLSKHFVRLVMIMKKALI